MLVLSALKPQLVLPRPTHTSSASPSCASMVAKTKGKESKSKVLAKASAAKKAPEKQFTSSLACGFRNLMKYRASEQCKKALTVWGS